MFSLNFKFDEVWQNDRGFVKYDFNAPNLLPTELANSFDVIVIDPPFITEEVWRKYAISGHFLLKKGVDESRKRSS